MVPDRLLGHPNAIRRKGALRNIAELSDNEAAALAAVEVSEIFEGRGEEGRLIGALGRNEDPCTIVRAHR